MKTINSDENESDNRLIARFVSTQDKLAYAELVTRYQSSIRQFLRRLTAGDHHLADDISQETFLLMYRKLHTFRGSANLSTWLHKIAYNCFLRYVQTLKDIEFVDQDLLQSIESVQPDMLTDIMLERLMKNLSVEERLMLTLSFSVGMSHGEIVELTNYPLGTVKSHINRAKLKLIKLVSPKVKVA